MPDENPPRIGHVFPEIIRGQQLKPAALHAGMRRAIEGAMNTILPFAAIGYSILYMVFGGGLFGAIVIFVIAKIFRK